MTFNFKQTKEKIIPLTPDAILARISPSDIYARYLGFTPKVNKNYKSPFRGGDDTPSFGLYYGAKTGDLMFKDLGGNKFAGNCFIFVQRLHQESFFEALKRVNIDFQLGLGKNLTNNDAKPIIYAPDEHKEHKDKTKITFNRRAWTNEDFDYWGEYGISESVLEFYNVYPLKDVFINNRLRFRHTPGQLMYSYVFGPEDVKIYRPFAANKEDKWRSNCSSDVIQGLDQLPEEGLFVVVTKSLKDVMVYRMFGIAAVAPQSEVPFLPDWLVDDLEKRFDYIIVNYDNDQTGIMMGESLAKNNGWDKFFIPKVYQKKDISDFYKTYGHLNTLKLIENNLLWHE